MKLDESASTGIMAHLVAGFPDDATTVEAARAIAAGGATVLELQYPFSDPLADGPTVLAACHEALSGGLDHRRFLDLTSEISKSIPIPVVVMTYANIPFVRGFDRFARELAAAGARGVIAPDLPHTEPEFEPFHAALREAGLSYVPVIAPTSTRATIRELADLAPDFLYVVVRLGVTGMASDIGEPVRARLDEVAGITPKPLAAGFGIRSRDQVAHLEGKARLAVVGSRIVEVIRDARPGQTGEAVETFVRSLLA